MVKDSAVIATLDASPLHLHTLTNRLAAELRELILNNTFREGQQLRQDAIAARFRVSRIPVREALRQLEAEGLVTLTPHRGATVTALSLEAINELFELRALLEVDLLERAIPRLAEASLDEASQVLEQFDAAFRDRNVAIWGKLNWRFHSILYQCAGRERSYAIVDNLHLHVDRYIRLQLNLVHGTLQAHEDHWDILRHCRARDVDLATVLLRRHIINAGRELVAFLGEQRAVPISC